MSTRRIRELLKWARAQDADVEAFDGAPIGPPPLDEVEAEVEAIEKAARHLVDRDIRDEEAAAEGRETWALLDRIAKESGK